MRIVLHAWAALPVVEDGRVSAVLFESKAVDAHCAPGW